MARDIAKLVGELTLEEKAGLVSGADFWHTKSVERLGIPAVTVSDGPHGVRTADANLKPDGTSSDAVCFPAACATASSFDTGLLTRIGEALGDECNALGVSILLGPAANIKRSPLCGRNFEYISEDPHVVGQVSAALINGIQGKGVGTSMKHFAANNQEFCRLAVSAEIDERALREIYLAGFEYAVKQAKPWTLMCSYNRINGVQSSQNPWLLTDVLRGEWGFEGYVMSDWGAVDNRVEGIKAGLDLEMPGPGYQAQSIIDAVNGGELDMALLDLCVTRVLTYVFKYVDNVGGTVPPSGGLGTIPYEAHNALAAEASADSAVLLKNDGAVLPLTRGKKVAFIGGFAEKPRFQGGGSSNIKPNKVTSALEAAGGSVSYAKGFDIEGDVYDEKLAAEALELAKSSETAVIFAGLPDSFESEGYDRKHMRLPDCQNRLIAQIAAAQPNTVVVLHNGSPVEMPWVGEVPAILEMYLGGQAVGEATVKLLFGEINPSGKLAETFPVKLEDNPSFLNFPGTEQSVAYAESIYVGYRYYDKKKMDVLFPFGHGLSYTTFSYSNLRYNDETISKEHPLKISVDVTNTGGVRGKEAVQLYISGHGTVRELRAFAKLDLAPGETKTAAFTLDWRALAHWEQSGWHVPNGEREFSIGRSSRDLEFNVKFTVQSDELLPLTVTSNTTGVELLRDPRTAATFREALKNSRLPFGDTPPEELTDETAGFGGFLELPIGRFLTRNNPNLIEMLNAKL